MGVRTRIGADIEENFKKITPFWEETVSSGTTKQIVTLMNTEPMGLLAVSTMDESGDEGYYYICAATNKPAPDGMFEVNIPKHTWAIFSGSGHPTSIGDLYKRVLTEWLPISGYEWADMIDIEVYLDDDPVNMKYEVWMPVIKKKT